MDLFIKFLVAAVGAGTPLLFGTVGEILNEKVGHLNLGVEGMMAIGACAGFMAGYLTDNFALALLAAFGAGVLSALVYAVLTVTFMANQNVAGLTMTIFGVGLSLLLPRFFGLDGVLYSMPVSDVLTFLISAVVLVRTYRALRQGGGGMSFSAL